jgi:GAF domain-containing protein/ActR/RegA family two-component response regulator
MAGEKILIIEDEQDIALMIDTLMQERGYRTVVAHDGVSGLGMALQEQPDLILLDLRLPQMSGVQLLYKLDEHQVNAPVVVVTAWGSEELAVQALRMGVKDYVKKPFNLNELIGVVERTLGEGRLRQERDVLTQKLLVSNQQLKQRLAQLTALYKVGQAQDVTLDLDKLLNVILKEACRVLGVDVASIFLLDDESRELVFRSGIGSGSERLVGLRLAPGQGVAGWVAQYGEPVLVRDTQADPRFDSHFDQITKFTTESILCVPLVLKGRVIGVVQALNKPQAGFTQDDMALLRSLATSAAVAIENTRLFNETNRRLRESNVLFRLGKQLTALLPMRQLLQIAVNGAVELVPKAGRSTIYTYEQSSGVLRAEASSRPGMSPGDILWEPMIKRRIVGRALQEHRTIAAQMLRSAQTQRDEFDIPYAGILAVPLRVQKENLGVLTVDGQAFTGEDQHILTTFANQVAIAIKNVRLHDQTERQLAQRTRAYREIRALQETTGALLSPLDLQDVLDQIVQSVVSGLGYSAAMLAEYDEQNKALSVRAIDAAERSLIEAGEELADLRVLEADVTLDQTENLAVRAFLTGEIRVTHDLYDLFRPVVSQEMAQKIQTEAGIYTLATIPLRSEDRPVGNLFAGTNRKQLSETSLHSLQTLANQAAIAIDKARLYQNRQERLRELERLQKTALELGELTVGASLQDVYRRLTEHAATLLETKSSAILLFDGERQALICQEPAFGVPSDFIQKYHIPLGPGSPAQQAWEFGKSLMINNVAESPLAQALGLTELAAQRDLRSTMFSILRIGGASIGVFQVSDKRDGSDFTPDDKRILEIFASQSAITIENARLFTQERHRASEMETLVAIAQAVTKAVTEDPRALLERIARGACEVLHADCAVLYPFADDVPDTYDVENVAAFGTLHPVKLDRKAPPDDPVRIVRKRNPWICQDIAHDRPDLLQNPFFGRESIRGFVGVLLEADGEERGVLYVNFRSPYRFEERELTTLQLIAHQAALAIAKSRLFQAVHQDLVQALAELKRQLREMEEMRKISNMISSTLEQEKVFDGILQGVMSITGAPYANIMVLDEESGAVISRRRREDQTVTETIDPHERVTVPLIAEGEHSTIVQDIAEPSVDAAPLTGIYRRLIPDARSMTYAPITTGGSEQKRIGLLGIGSPHPDEFGPADKSLLKALARQAAIAIQNARYVQTVRDYQERQVEAERIAAVADVAGNMVHRINNTVGAIRPLIQQIEIKLDRGRLNEDYLRDKLKRIRESANQTLEMARQIRRPFQSAPLQPIDVNASIAAAWANLKPAVGIETEFDYGEDLPLVEATQQLDEVFRNLMKNALDAMTPHGGLLSVRSRRKNERMVEVTIQDTGPGIPPELREKIFRMGVTTKPGGLGYGLWWSRMFLRRLEGDMALQSCEGQGCTFTVTLPISIIKIKV